MHSIKNNSINESDISIIAIQNYGRSGSLLFHSLLDNHPDILSIPALNILGFYEFWEKLDVKDLSSIIKKFISINEHWFNPQLAQLSGWGLGHMGEKRNEKIYLSKKVFTKLLHEIFQDYESPTRKDFLLGLFIAYSLSINRKIHNPRFLIYPIHSLPNKYVLQLIEDFEKIKFVYTVREPVQNLNSTINHIKNFDPSLNSVECAMSLILNNYLMHIGGKGSYVYADRTYSHKYAKESKALKLEDLHHNSENTIREITHWLGIKWDECLLKSTFDGKKWWNVDDAIKISGFNKEITSQKREKYINDFDRIRLEALFFKRYLYWGYKNTKFINILLVRVALFFTLILPFKAEYMLLHIRIKFGIIKPLISNLKLRFNYCSNWIKYTIVHRFKLKYALKIKSFLLKFFSKYMNRIIPYKLMLSFFKMIAFILGFIFVIPIIIIRLTNDYFKIRWWLYRGWFVNQFKINEIVRPL